MDKEKFIKEVAVNKGRGGVWLSLAKGDNKLRLVGDFEKIQTHYLGDLINKMAGSGDIEFPRSVACGEHFAKPCPFCAYAKKLLASTEETDQGLSVKMRSKPRYFWNTLVTVDDNTSAKVVEVGPQAFKALGEVFDAWGDFTDPKTGYSVIITVGEEAGWTKYWAKADSVKERLASGKEVPVAKESPLTEEEASIPLNDLATVKAFPSDEDLADFFENVVGTSLDSLGMKGRTAKTEQPASTETPVPAKQPETLVKDPNKKYRKCFGSFEPNEVDLCGKCADRDVCAKESGYKEGLK